MKANKFKFLINLKHVVDKRKLDILKSKRSFANMIINFKR